MTFSPGYKIGAYTVVRPLGQGGMGDVYEVAHEQLGTHYALKAFSCDYEEAEVLQKKFLEEGRLLSRLSHPRIVRVFDLAIEPASHMPYFVMDLVLYEDGEAHTIEDVERSDITENLVYLWFKDVAEALDYIHSQGIVHRDVKPSNLLLNSDYHVTLTDFGISRIFGEKIVHDVDASRTMASKTGRGTLVLGTERYIAPEVARGEEATPAADAYALGMMCFRLLTGMWYEHGTDALSLLSKYKLRWMSVLPQLLSLHAEKRPKELYRLKERLKGTLPAPARVQPQNKPRPRKKFDVFRFFMSTLFVAGFVAGASWFAYQGFLKYDGDRKRESERVNAELKRQIAEQKEASQRIESEQKRLAAEASVRQKAERERLEAAKRRADLEQKAEANREKIGRDESAPTKRVAIPVREPVQCKKDEFVLVNGVTDKPRKDYGPIPDRTYSWLKGGNVALPQEVKFLLSNGAVIDLVPLKAATFYMPNDMREGRVCHKVTITRPFWMSRFLLTADQWREFAPRDCEECRAIEKALEGTGYTVSKLMTRPQIDAYCKFLTEKYQTQLPKGYVFRLPTEAEWWHALDLEGTIRLYEDKGGYPSKAQWYSRDGIAQMVELRKKRNLDLICKWVENTGHWRSGGLSADDVLCIGGRMKPYASGVHDVLQMCNVFLDVVESGRGICGNKPFAANFAQYGEVCNDPLAWVPNVDIYTNTSSARREWSNWVYPCNMSGRILTHIVLGPDLIAERAWESCCKEVPRKARNQPLEMLPVKWDPKASPRKLNGERKYEFILDNGIRMDFCLCPAGRFDMSNIDGQSKLTHRVTITRPFLMSKYNITAGQWRDFGPYDCEGVPRVLENLFKKEKYPICVRRNWMQWDRFCAYLTKRYRKVLPAGYAFRLPTEAELEYAMLAGFEGGVNKLDSRLDDCVPLYRDEFSRLLAKKRFPDVKHFDNGGWYREHYVGGRVSANAWGICDMRMDKACLDFLDADRRVDLARNDGLRSDGHLCLRREMPYGETEIDPVRWDGLCGHWFLRRWGWSERCMWAWHATSMAHIVIGPDLLAERKKCEEDSYPVEDFGGVYIGDKARLSGMSSTANHSANTVARHKLLLSRENVVVRELTKSEDLRGAHTNRESSPWIQIELAEPTVLAGIEVDNFWWQGHTVHLRIWVSDGSDEMVLVAQTDRVQRRYRFDLNAKNIKAKYIRIGREPGFVDNHFTLNKVLIYGKKP